MMAGADRDVLFIQYGAQIVRVNPLHREGDDSRRIFGAEQSHRIEAAQHVAGLAGKRALMREQVIQIERGEIVDRRSQRDRLGDHWRAGLEALRRRGIGGARETDLVDHRAATLPWWHRLEQVFAPPEHADPGRSIELVA